LQILAVGELVKGAPVALVMASVEPLPKHITLQQVAYSMAALLPDTELTFDSVDDDCTICRMTHGGQFMVNLVVLLRAGDRVFAVNYVSMDTLAYELETLFEASVPRIVIKSSAATTTSLIEA
jgi:hypothetical protein